VKANCGAKFNIVFVWELFFLLKNVVHSVEKEEKERFNAFSLHRTVPTQQKAVQFCIKIEEYIVP